MMLHRIIENDTQSPVRFYAELGFYNPQQREKTDCLSRRHTGQKLQELCAAVNTKIQDAKDETNDLPASDRKAAEGLTEVFW